MSKTNPFGFIKIHRKILDWEWYSDTNAFRLFIHLLLSANYEDKKFQGLDIKRGQLVVGRIELAKSTNLSEQQIRTALTKLKSTNEITIQSTNKFSIIELVNYNLYQDNKKEINQQDNQPINNPITNDQPTDNQRITTTKEIKNIRNKEDKNIIDLSPRGNPRIDPQQERYWLTFEEFWQLYKPIHTGKGNKEKSKELFFKAIKKDTMENIAKGLQSYMSHCHAKNSYTKSVEVWLRNECWKDEYSGIAEPAKGKVAESREVFKEFLNQDG